VLDIRALTSPEHPLRIGTSSGAFLREGARS